MTDNPVRIYKEELKWRMRKSSDHSWISWHEDRIFRRRWPRLCRAHISFDGVVLAALAFLPTSSEAVSCNLEQVLQIEAVCYHLGDVLQLWRARIAAKERMTGHVATEAQETMAPRALFCA